MKEKDMLKNWILPELKCNAGTACHDYVARNKPGEMPLDTFLLNNLDERIER